ncbi:thiamine phosphate synthase [Domibacillus epiphyticus]|uniref:Thiamine-phosphate synthase n=1 Tax=Domibacillus epiphyticus TaxID=1714355 RepID=A0A1V2A5H3_9BACI|nr:thiamine phosphate synthase [Domibacillus epiphyticus]OMP66187.1 thiamine-phosphate diphosphorylase [Domibacillus epiphyticus]
MKKEQLAVYFIAGTPNCRTSIDETLQAAIHGGITMFQFREKGEGALTGETKKHQALRLQSMCKQAGIPFIVNDDIDLAIEIGADGVHIGQEDEPASVVRKKIKGGIVGVSVHTMDEFEKAIIDGADYVGTGPIYSTATKTDARPVAGTTLIAKMKEKYPHFPIVGIGGITIENAVDVMKAGADGVSVITAISHANKPDQAASKLKNVFSKTK